MFLLAYGVKGFTWPLGDLDAEDRTWFLRRLKQQIERETKAMTDR